MTSLAGVSRRVLASSSHSDRDRKGRQTEQEERTMWAMARNSWTSEGWKGDAMLGQEDGVGRPQTGDVRGEI